MKRFIFLYCLLPGLVWAQSNIRLNNYWQNMYYINPASINEDYKGVFSLVARDQWIGFSGAPKTLFASGTLYANRMNTQFGLRFMADHIGYTTFTNATLSYSYAVPIDREWTLNLGLGGSFQSLTYDRDQVSTMSADDPVLYENLLQTFNYNSDLGAELVGQDWHLGISSQNMLTSFFKGDRLLENTNYLYATYRKNTQYLINVLYGVCAIQTKNTLQLETNLSGYFNLNEDPDALQVSLLYRTRNEMGLILGINLSQSFHVAYSYDFNVSGISRYSIGSHELMLVYKMDRYKYKPYRY